MKKKKLYKKEKEKLNLGENKMDFIGPYQWKLAFFLLRNQSFCSFSFSPSSLLFGNSFDFGANGNAIIIFAVVSHST